MNDMIMKVIKNPFVYLLRSLGRLFLGRLKYFNEYVGTTITIENGETYHIFRHIASLAHNSKEHGAVLIVRFKFARFPYAVNKFISQFPMLLITGFPGFQTKMYAVNPQNGYWLGMYQWRSKQALDDYKQSFVLHVMNMRAQDGSVTYREFEQCLLIDYNKDRKTK
jgi:hypothetical protein